MRTVGITRGLRKIGHGLWQEFNFSMPHHTLNPARQSDGGGGEPVGHAGGRAVQEVIPGDRRQRRRRQNLHRRWGGGHLCGIQSNGSAQGPTTLAGLGALFGILARTPRQSLLRVLLSQLSKM